MRLLIVIAVIAIDPIFALLLLVSSVVTDDRTTAFKKVTLKCLHFPNSLRKKKYKTADKQMA